MPANKKSSKTEKPKVKETKTLSEPPIHLDKYLVIHSGEYNKMQHDLLMSVLDRRKMRTEKEWDEVIHTELTREFV